jgi:hypothetical protein
MTSSWENESSASHDMPPTSQYEQLRLISDTLLAAVDVAEKLDTLVAPESVSREFILSETLHADVLKLPQAWKEIVEELQELSTRFEYSAGSDRSYLTLRASFGDDWHSSLARPSHAPTSQPFTGEALQIKSEYGPEIAAQSRQYPVTASQQEIAELMKSLLYAPFQSRVDIGDPQDFHQAKFIQDTLHESRGAETIEEVTYRFQIDGEEYEIECFRSNGAVAAVEINHIIQDEVVFVDNEPRRIMRKIVARMELDGSSYGIDFYYEKDNEPAEPIESDMAMVQRVMEIIGAIDTTLPASPDEVSLDKLKGEEDVEDLLGENGFDSPDAS